MRISREVRQLLREYFRRVARGEAKALMLPDADLKANYDARPTQSLPILAQSGVELMRWGIQPGWADRIIINATTEKRAGRFWSKAFRERRCLVPADGWYEWTGKAGAKQAHALQSSEPTGLGALWFDDAEHGHSFVVMTAPAAKPISWIHTRMPVLVPMPQWEQWLDPAFDAGALAATFAGEVTTFECASPKYDVAPVPA